MRKTYREKKSPEYWASRWNQLPVDGPAEGHDRYPLLYANLVVGEPDGEVLELGCGAGRLLRYYHAKGTRIVGVDNIAPVISKLQACDPQLHVMHADARTLPFETGRFTTVLCFGVYHSLEDGVAAAISETFRVLRPGGRLCAEFRSDSLHNRLIDHYKGAASTLLSSTNGITGARTLAPCSHKLAFLLRTSIRLSICRCCITCQSCGIHRKGAATNTQSEFLAIACGPGLRPCIPSACGSCPAPSLISTSSSVANQAKLLPGRSRLNLANRFANLVRMRSSLLAISALLLASRSPFASAQTPASVTSRLAAQNALFDESWQATLKLNPTLATAIGDYRYNDQLGDSSLAAPAARHQSELADLARIQAIDSTGFPEQALISHDLFLRQLQQRVADYDLKEFEMPLSSSGGGGGIHVSVADLPLSMPFDSVKHYQDYISRLHQIPKAFLQTEEVLRAGVSDHLVPVRFIAEKVPAQAEGVITANPFILPLKKFPASFSDADKKRLANEITSTVDNEVFPAYKQFVTFVTSDYLPNCRTTLSINSLGGGGRRYQATLRRFTTTDLTAAQIHDIGLKEVHRITEEMAALAKTNGYKDLASFRDHVENDPKYQPASANAIVEDFRKYIEQMEPHLPQLFNLLPKTAVTVEPIPPFQAAAATHYQGGTPDGKRPGRVSVAVSDPTHRSFINDEAVAYHEGVPGHHLQITIQQSLTSLPEFRKHGGNSAYTEGWGLYAEELGKEIGFYQDPGSDYGRLRSELFRAVRLVVDTGIHDMNWSRDQVVEYMRTSHAVDEPTIQAETDRYISGPGQACSYKLGQLKIRELRERAKQQLGPKFDLKAFHDEILSGGALPLDVLDARIDRWIKAQLS